MGWSHTLLAPHLGPLRRMIDLRRGGGPTTEHDVQLTPQIQTDAPTALNSPRRTVSGIPTFDFRPHPMPTMLQMAGVFGGLAAQRTLTDFPDVDLVSPPPESISTIEFSPVADHLAVASWGPNVSFFDSSRAESLLSTGGVWTCSSLILLLGGGGRRHSRFGYTT